MSKTAGKLLCAACAGTAAVFGAGYLTFREVMYRDAKLFRLVAKMTLDSAAKKAPPAAKVPDEREEWFKRQTLTEYTIEGSRGNKLHGYLLKADEPSDVYVFGSHGYRSRGRSEFRLMAKYHHDRGRNLFFVDHQSAGDSEGDYIGFGYYEYRDSLKWLDFMIATFGADIKIILHGVSMGSATVMLMSGDSALPENVRFTVADCGYTSAQKEFEYVLKNAHVPAFPLLNTADLFNSKINGYHFRDVDALESVSHSKVPILFIHGSTDTFVPTFMAKELYDACPAYKQLLIIDGAWHAESYPKGSSQYEAKVDEFAEMFL